MNQMLLEYKKVEWFSDKYFFKYNFYIHLNINNGLFKSWGLKQWLQVLSDWDEWMNGPLWLRELRSTARVNRQLVEHFLFHKQFSKNLSFSFYSFRPPRPRGECGCQTCTKTFLGQAGMCVKNSSRLMHVFGFPLALYIPQTHLYIYR